VAVAVVGLPGVVESTPLAPSDLPASLGVADDDFVLGAERSTRRIKANSIVRYNLLHQATEQARGSEAWDFTSEPVFRALFGSTLIDRCIVLVAPTSELRDAAVQHLPLARIYELLFNELDARSIPYDVLMSRNTVDGLEPTDRVFVHHNLRGKHITLPDPERVRAIANSPNRQYQSVRLPHGILTHTQGYDHLHQDRDRVLAALLPHDIAGRSVLDIGSAMGALLFVAERMGAERIVGVEMHDQRHAGSVELAEVLHSRAHFHRGDFESFNPEETFDHVFALNVLHHVPDFHRFLTRAAAAAAETLTLEFPTLIDRKFARAHRLTRFLFAPLNRLPLIGVSSIHAVDQTFVYSPVAVKHLVMNEIGGFRSCDHVKSENSHRAVMRFSREPMAR
jgi:2-polyprenyl-3-methyl-5-hydroxy-6-metoxy-1,4-benzoquinol methylase